VDTDRKIVDAKSSQTPARRSLEIRAFLVQWARRHMPDRVTRFTSR
jgi:hypothetical protein